MIYDKSKTNGMELMVNNTFLKDCRAIAAIEFAIILPFIVALLFAMTEFGLYYTKEQVISRAVNNTSNAIQSNALNPELRNDAQKAGFGLVNFEAPNYFCAKSYATREQADAYCNPGDWETGTPSGLTAGAPYYVALIAFYDYVPLTQLTDYMPDITLRNVVMVSTAETQTHGIALLTTSPSTNSSPSASISGSWQVPDGVSSMKVTLVSGGWSGWGNTSGTNAIYEYAGGESGNVLVAYISGLTAGQSLSYTLGGGGAAAGATSVSAPGGATLFNGLQASGGSSYSTSASQGTVTSYSTFNSNKMNLKSMRDWHENDPVDWSGESGSDTPLGFGVGGRGSFLKDGYNSTQQYNGSGYGSGGAGKGTRAAKAGHGAGGAVLIEW